MTFDSAYAWVIEHKVLCGILFYVLLNVAKRVPAPKTQPWLSLWLTFESIMILPWDVWLGLPKTVPVLPTTEQPTDKGQGS